jgi:hypothetical protein
VSCHNASNPSGNTDLSSYNSIVNNPSHADLVAAGHPENSHLYEMTESGQMPPTGALSAAEVDAIKTWIANGAQNN